MNLDAGDADVALNCDRIAPERERLLRTVALSFPERGDRRQAL